MWSEQYISAQILMDHANKCDGSMGGTEGPQVASLGGGGEQDHVLIISSQNKKKGAACAAVTEITVNRYTRSTAIPLKPHVTTCYSSYTAIKPVYIKATNLPEMRSLGCRFQSSHSSQQCSSFPDVVLPHVFVFNCCSKTFFSSAFQSQLP